MAFSSLYYIASIITQINSRESAKTFLTRPVKERILVPEIGRAAMAGHPQLTFEAS